MTTKRRIEITVFRRQRITATDVAFESSPQPSTAKIDESLVEEIAALVKQLTGDSLGNIKVRQEIICTDEDSEGETR